MSKKTSPYLAAAGVSLLIISGCASPSTPAANPSPSVAHEEISYGATSDPDSTDLTSLGCRHAPHLSVPATLTPLSIEDHPQVIVVIVNADQAVMVDDYLTNHLESDGWVIDDAKDGAIVFHNSQWDGAYIIGDDMAGLTLRSDRASFVTPRP